MRVLVATDLSEAGLLSTEVLIGCNPQLFSGVTIVHAVELDDYMAAGDVLELTEWSEARLAEEVATLTESGFVAEYRMEQGDAPEVVREVAAEVEADLIIVTDRGRSGAAGRLLGSTATRIAQDTEVPVLVVRVEQRDAAWCRVGQASPFTHPLVAADLDETLERIATATDRLPGVESVRVMHVAAPGEDLSQAHAFVEAVIERTPIRDAEVLVVEGRDPAAALAAEALASGATLIVLAPRRHGLVGRIVLGSVALDLLTESRLPLLFA